MNLLISMRKILDTFNEIIKKRERGISLVIFLVLGAFTGITCVAFMWAFEFVLTYRLDAAQIGYWTWITTPALFLFAAELIRRTAPYAGGSGIPQATYAATHLDEASMHKLYPLVSIRTMLVKIVAVLLVIWAGASAGREGPTVQIAACIFLGGILLVRRYTKMKPDIRSAVIAGGAAGLAAAFNTPLAGVTFAIEELSENYFSSIKESVLMAIILAGISAIWLTGEYSYFGLLEVPKPVALGTVIMIGIAGGLCGAFFSTALLKGQKILFFMRGNFWRYALPVFFALGLLGINHLSSVDVLGPGNDVAQQIVSIGFDKEMSAFPFWKMAATLLTFWSGNAGGIFAPSLSMGAGLGAAIGYLSGEAIRTCAVIGMAAFLAGTVQAPMTAFVIIFEMTGHHEMLLPLMLASLIAVLTARLLGAKRLYQTLAEMYGKQLGHIPS